MKLCTTDNKFNGIKENNDEVFVGFKKELLFKVLVLGDFGSGKTSIIKRFAEDTFSSAYKITIGADFALKKIDYDESTKINLQLWDIAGHARFGDLTKAYYRYANAVAFVFDLSRPQTFKSVEKWLSDLKKRLDLSENEMLPMVLLANKGDVAYNNVPNEIDEFCKTSKIMKWFITSAKENMNIDEAFDTLLKAVINNFNNKNKLDNDVIILSSPGKEEIISNQCCNT